MKTAIILSIALLAFSEFAFAQDVTTSKDTTSNPIIPGDPAMKQSSQALQENILKDMVKITSVQLPDGVKKAVESDEFKGSKTFFKHKSKDEYAVEVRDGEVSSYHFYDKEGKPLNKRD